MLKTLVPAVAALSMTGLVLAPGNAAASYAGAAASVARVVPGHDVQTVHYGPYHCHRDYYGYRYCHGYRYRPYGGYGGYGGYRGGYYGGY